MGDEGVGEGLAWEGLVDGEGLEGLPSLISVTGDEGLVEGGLEGGDLVRGEGLWWGSWEVNGLVLVSGLVVVVFEGKD